MNDFTEQELREIIGMCKNESKIMDVLEGMAPVNGELYRINLSMISMKAKKLLEAGRKPSEVPNAAGE